MTLRAEGASFAVRGRALVADVSVESAPSRLTVVVGPNGAGKSTLLSMLSAERAPTSGAVELEGRALARWDRRERARRIATMHQRSRLDADFTVREVVALGRWPHGDRGVGGRSGTYVDEAIATAGIESLVERGYRTLSGGERQLVHLARAIAQVLPMDPKSPRVLLLDEPTASLDVAHARRVLSAVRRACGPGLGALIVLHDLALAAAHADEMLVMARGRTVARGAPDDVWHASLVREVWGIEVVRVTHPDLARPVLVPVWEETR